MNPQIIQDEQPRLKNIYLFVGRSGSGKTTITDALWKRFGWKPLWSYTDRPRRTPNEQYHEFLTTAEFDKLEGIMGYTEFDNHRYCATSAQLDRSDMYVIDPAGVVFLKEHYHGSRKIVTIGIGVSRENLARRMSARGESSVNIEARMRNDDEMFQRMNECCDVIFDNNGDLEQTIAEIADFIEKKEEYT